MARSIGFSVVWMLPCVNCCDTDARLTPMPIGLAPAPLSAAAYTSANSAREALAPGVAALAMLLPITSRLLAVAFRPDKPCWKLMGSPSISIENFDLVVAHRAGVGQLEHQAVGAGAHRVHSILRVGGGGDGGGAQGRADAEL